jgi:hypothetical protein
MLACKIGSCPKPCTLLEAVEFMFLQVSVTFLVQSVDIRDMQLHVKHVEHSGMTTKHAINQNHAWQCDMNPTKYPK